MFEHLENAMCEELDRMNEDYKSGKEITAGDLAKAEQIGRTLKNLAIYEDVKGGYEGQSERSYGSYARGRSRTTGRYMSRDGGSMMGSRTGYPREMIDPYWDRR